MTSFALPRFFAVVSTSATVQGLAVWPFIGYGWRASAGLLCTAAVAAWISHDTSRMVRRRIRLERELRQRRDRIAAVERATRILEAERDLHNAIVAALADAFREASYEPRHDALVIAEKNVDLRIVSASHRVIAGADA